LLVCHCRRAAEQNGERTSMRCTIPPFLPFPLFGAFMATVFGYIRRGFRAEEEEEESQDQAIEAFARSHLPSLTWGGVYTDRATTRRRPLTSRPMGMKVSLEAERADHVVIARSDRAFANLLDLVETNRTWAARGVLLNVLDVGLYAGTAEAPLVLRTCAALVQAEAFRASERAREMLDKRRREGKPVN